MSRRHSANRILRFRYLGALAGRTAFANDVNEIGNHGAAYPKAALENGVNALGQQFLGRPPRNHAVCAMAQDFDHAAAIQHVRHDQGPDGTGGMDLVKQRTERRPFDVQVQDNKLRFQRLQ